jgi:hypothetical protein
VNILGQEPPDDRISIPIDWSQTVPPEVEARLRQRFTDLRSRVVARRRETWWLGLGHGFSRRRWVAAMGGAVAVVVLTILWSSAHSNAWAQVVKRMQSKPWIHARIVGREGEFWISSSQGIVAVRHPGFAEFDSRGANLKLRYRVADRTLIHLPMTSLDEDVLRQIEAIFGGLFQDKAGIDPSTSLEQLVKQQTVEVEADGKRWVDFQLTFRQIDGGRERVTVYRVDPETRLPKFRIDRQEFADDPQMRLELDYPESGPADVFALGVPRDAKVVDYVPTPELTQILAGMRAGREAMDTYSGLIVQGSSRSHWSEASTVWRVWRNGKKWRIEQSEADIPGPLRREMLGKDNPPRPKNDVDPRAWWREAAKTIRFYPVLVSDGQTSYRFKVEVTPKRLTTKNLKVLKYEIESVAPDYIAIPANDGGPTAQLLPEYVGRPPLGIPAEGCHVSVDPLPIRGPKDAILVSVQDTRPPSSAWRAWVDPRRGYLAIRYELETGRDGKGNPQNQVQVIEQVAQSPRGIWYPRLVRTASGIPIGEDIANHPSGLIRYFLDFESIPNEVFATPSLIQPQQAEARTPTKPRTRAQEVQHARSMRNLSIIAKAMYAYQTEHQHFPPATLVGPDGKTTYSWRVALLPNLGFKALFDGYKLTEPWDSPNNLKILAQMPDVYRADESGAGTNAAYFVVTGQGTLFPAGRALDLAQIRDGAADTLLVVEAKRAIPWTKSEDLTYDAKGLLPPLGGFDPEGFCAAFADASSRFIERAKFNDDTLRAWITPSGGEDVKRQD